MHQACGQERHNNEFTHAHDAVVHRFEPSKGCQCAGCYANQSSQNGCRGKHQHHIHAGEGCHYNIYIRYNGRVEDLAQIVGLYADGWQTGIKNETNDGCRQGNPDVCTELVLHLATLSLRCHNGGVGDEAEVVAKVSAPNHDRHHHGCAGFGLFCHATCNGNEGCNGAYAGSRSE